MIKQKPALTIGMKSMIIVIMSFISLSSLAQVNEEAAVKQTINNFFTGMKNGDTVLLKSTIAETALLQTVAQNKEGNVIVRNEAMTDFITVVGKPHAEVYDERIEFETIKIDGNLASVWTLYKFYVGEKFSHCGVNSFQLVRLNGQWKIQYIIDTRRKTDCK